VGLLIYLLFALAAFSILWWAVTQLTLPPPVRTVVIVVAAVVALIFLWQVAGPYTHSPGLSLR